MYILNESTIRKFDLYAVISCLSITAMNFDTQEMSLSYVAHEGLVRGF